jgi:hypothetical protein
LAFEFAAEFAFAAVGNVGAQQRADDQAQQKRQYDQYRNRQLRASPAEKGQSYRLLVLQHEQKGHGDDGQYDEYQQQFFNVTHISLLSVEA